MRAIEAESCTASHEQDLGSLRLLPGVHCLEQARLGGILTLDAQGDPSALFVFRVARQLIVTGASVVLDNAASEAQVFWQVGESASIGEGSTFVGSILAREHVRLGAGTKLAGRAIAHAGIVTIESTQVTLGELTELADSSPR